MENDNFSRAGAATPIHQTNKGMLEDENIAANDSPFPVPRDSLERLLVERAADLEKCKHLLRAEIGEHQKKTILLEDHLKLGDRWSRLAANIPGFMHIFCLTKEGQLSASFASAGIQHLYGVQPADVADSAAHLADLLHPDDRARIKLAIAESARNLTPFNAEFRICHPEKGEIWAEARSVPEASPDGSILWYGITLDITERKRLEHAVATRDTELHALSKSSPGMMGSFHLRPNGTICMPYVSPNIWDLFGLLPQDVANDAMPLLAMTHPDDAQRVNASIAESGRTMAPWREEYRILHPTRGERWMEGRTNPEPHPDGGTVWYGYVHDITDRKNMEDALNASETQYRIVFESANDGIFLYRIVQRNGITEFILHDLNRKGCEMWGYSREDILSGNFDLLAMSEPPYTFEEATRRNRLAAAGQPQLFDWSLKRGGGSKIWGEVNLRQVRMDGEDFLLAVMRDITERKQMEELLRHQEQEFRTLVENSSDTIARYDRHSRRMYANPRLVASMGGDMACILGTTPAQYPGGASAQEYENMLQQVIEHGQERNFELRWKTADVEHCSQIRMTPEFDRFGQVTHVLAVGRDISEIDRYRKKIHNHAFFDNLTGLPNRQLLSDRIAQTIADAAYHGHQFGLLLLDLDNFKQVNDTLGHNAGDLLLREAAKRMQSCVRAYDTVARLGGDEFAVLLPDMRKGDDLATIADKILHELAEPFTIDGRELFVTCSLGIALYPDDSSEVDVLFKYADSAMYHAKKLGRNNFQFYAKELTSRTLERMEIEAALRKAQKNGELALYYQPQIELKTGRVTGFEALLRWFRPGHGLVAPDRFIPIAEDSGLIVEMGEWVLRTACATVVDWNREREVSLKMAINLSTRQFIRNDIVGSVRRALMVTGCQPEWLELEITESLLLEDSSEVEAMLATFHRMGMSISIDDFGTGYSALSYLNRFPVRQLKIDRSFIRNIPEQRDKSELVKAILSITTALQLESVAEGVETFEQSEYLLAQGCQIAQGYLYGGPMSRADCELWMVSKCSSNAE
jgi:diguanylate cyclase (GGDEF)-like protein/PAS domain S-box-containing protein